MNNYEKSPLKDLTDPQTRETAREMYKKNPEEVFDYLLGDMEKTCEYIQNDIKEISKYGDGKVVVGLSGGIDSALVATLAARALGKENVYAVLMPSSTNPEKSIEDGEKVAKQIGIDYEIISIAEFEPLYKMVEKKFERLLNPTEKEKKFAQGNAKSRTRMVLLYLGSNLGGGLVIGTDNRSENLIGYFTKYGDGGVDFNPIEELYKTQVWKVSEYLGIDKGIIEKAPAAELGISRTDEEEIGMLYKNLDKIFLGRDLKFSDEEIIRYADVSRENIERAKDMFLKTDHKRKTPPGSGVIKYFDKDVW